MALVSRLREVAELRVKYADRYMPYAQLAESRHGFLRDLITLDEAITLRDVYGYPNEILTSLFTSAAGGQNRPAKYFSAAALVAGCGDIKAAKYLISQGLDFTESDDLAMKPIEVAARLGRAKMVRFLHFAAPVPVDDLGLDDLLSDLVQTMRGGKDLATFREVCSAYRDDFDRMRLVRNVIRAGACKALEVLH